MKEFTGVKQEVPALLTQAERLFSGNKQPAWWSFGSLMSHLCYDERCVDSGPIG